MSDFTEDNLISKLHALTNQQHSIQSTSEWLVKNSNNREIIIRLWLKTVKKESKGSNVVNLLYLANDIVQNARKTCPQFRDDFFPAIESAYRHCLEIRGKELESVMGKLVSVFRERQIFSPSQIRRLHEVHHQMKSNTRYPAPAGKDHGKYAPANPFVMEEAKKNAQDVLVSLKRLQNPPSTERDIRVELSKYPDNISCPEKLTTVRNSAEARLLLEQNEEALPMLEDYLKRLKEETRERESLEGNLNSLIQTLRLTIEQHERECWEVKRMEDRMKATLLEVEKSFDSLPDLTALMPDTPLPSVQDLFGKK